jgi:hypothetical protein
MISLAMIGEIQSLAKDDSPDMSAPRDALMKRLEEEARKEWLDEWGRGWRSSHHSPKYSPIRSWMIFISSLLSSPNLRIKRTVGTD